MEHVKPVFLILLHQAMCFQFFFIVLVSEKQYAVVRMGGGDKTHQTELKTMNQTSRFPANDGAV